MQFTCTTVLPHMHYMYYSNVLQYYFTCTICIIPMYYSIISHVIYTYYNYTCTSKHNIYCFIEQPYTTINDHIIDQSNR